MIKMFKDSDPYKLFFSVIFLAIFLIFLGLSLADISFFMALTSFIQFNMRKILWSVAWSSFGIASFLFMSRRPKKSSGFWYYVRYFLFLLCFASICSFTAGLIALEAASKSESLFFLVALIVGVSIGLWGDRLPGEISGQRPGG